MKALHWPAGVGGTAFWVVDGSRGLVPVVVQLASVPDSKLSENTTFVAAPAANVNPKRSAERANEVFIVYAGPSVRAGMPLHPRTVQIEGQCRRNVDEFGFVRTIKTSQAHYVKKHSFPSRLG